MSGASHVKPLTKPLTNGDTMTDDRLAYEYMDRLGPHFNDEARTGDYMVRAIIGGWRNVSEAQARAWIQHRWNHGFTARGWTTEEKVEYLRERVRGLDPAEVVGVSV